MSCLRSLADCSIVSEEEVLSLERLKSLSFDLVRRQIPSVEFPKAYFSTTAKNMPNSIDAKTHYIEVPGREAVYW